VARTDRIDPVGQVGACVYHSHACPSSLEHQPSDQQYKMVTRAVVPGMDTPTRRSPCAVILPHATYVI
jgi:hypothetical protein